MIRSAAGYASVPGVVDENSDKSFIHGCFFTSRIPYARIPVPVWTSAVRHKFSSAADRLRKRWLRRIIAFSFHILTGLVNQTEERMCVTWVATKRTTTGNEVSRAIAEILKPLKQALQKRNKIGARRRGI